MIFVILAGKTDTRLCLAEDTATLPLADDYVCVWFVRSEEKEPGGFWYIRPVRCEPVV